MVRIGQMWLSSNTEQCSVDWIWGLCEKERITVKVCGSTLASCLELRWEVGRVPDFEDPGDFEPGYGHVNFEMLMSGV